MKPYEIDPFPQDASSEIFSLSELNRFTQKAINEALPETYWICAETGDLRVNASSGHCYLEFIEKDTHSERIIAKARGIIWAQTFHMIKLYFEQETGQKFESGLKVLVKISVEFHELYGYSLNVHDIDPSYTLGDMAKKKKEIIHRLREEGIFELNKELSFPLLPRRIAVITSPTAAGFEDFIHQLTLNDEGFPFYPKLFPAFMQGEKTEESIVAALDKIYCHVDIFDVVVIIRGGGAASELSSFDSYKLAANCAQFPLPVITGIGHERDDTIVDMVAHTKMKTPTAVASFLIECMNEQAALLQESQHFIFAHIIDLIAKEKSTLQLLTTGLPAMVSGHIERCRNHLNINASHLKHAFKTAHSKLHRELELSEQYIKMSSPEFILKQGYTLTLKNGKIVKQAKALSAGDEVLIKFSDGSRKGQIS